MCVVTFEFVSVNSAKHISAVLSYHKFYIGAGFIFMLDQIKKLVLNNLQSFVLKLLQEMNECFLFLV